MRYCIWETVQSFGSMNIINSQLFFSVMGLWHLWMRLQHVLVTSQCSPVTSPLWFDTDRWAHYIIGMNIYSQIFSPGYQGLIMFDHVWSINILLLKLDPHVICLITCDYYHACANLTCWNHQWFGWLPELNQGKRCRKTELNNIVPTAKAAP